MRISTKMVKIESAPGKDAPGPGELRPCVMILSAFAGRRFKDFASV